MAKNNNKKSDKSLMTEQDNINTGVVKNDVNASRNKKIVKTVRS